MRVFDHRQTADTGANIHADTLGVLFSHFDTGVFERFHSGNHAEMNKSVHTASIFGWQKLCHVKIFNFSRNLTSKQARVKMRNPSNAGLAVHNILPRLGDTNTYWRYDTQACNNYSTFSQT